MTLEEVKEIICKNENYDEPVIIELIKLAGYRIKKDIKTRTDMIILT